MAEQRTIIESGRTVIDKRLQEIHIQFTPEGPVVRGHLTAKQCTICNTDPTTKLNSDGVESKQFSGPELESVESAIAALVKLVMPPK